ncbi:hypothetical protein C922_05722 [Plasmodium inui San Antonio 1]|uniref:Uncharacterized protein n=1 Tax=Plasmodium inui San Antonio 1 TaxID=1237626 RepID=W6ZSK3_9APIC|nr:hypothetical protein C922_05722 [Plasmodium inui San Antonio 1]EUD63897.1 hypothetical protein C922_05722 [Plasmodium inui San Antonio 1]
MSMQVRSIVSGPNKSRLEPNFRNYIRSRVKYRTSQKIVVREGEIRGQEEQILQGIKAEVKYIILRQSVAELEIVRKKGETGPNRAKEIEGWDNDRNETEKSYRSSG